MEQLELVLPSFTEAVRESGAFSYVDTDLKFTKPEVQVRLDRERLHNLGISAEEIAATVQSALREQRFGYFLREVKQYQVLGQLERSARSTLFDMARIFVRTGSGELISLPNVVDFEECVTAFFLGTTVSATKAAGAVRPPGEGVKPATVRGIGRAGFLGATAGGAPARRTSRSTPAAEPGRRPLAGRRGWHPDGRYR